MSECKAKQDYKFSGTEQVVAWLLIAPMFLYRAAVWKCLWSLTIVKAGLLPPLPVLAALGLAGASMLMASHHVTGPDSRTLSQRIAMAIFYPAMLLLCVWVASWLLSVRVTAS